MRVEEYFQEMQLAVIRAGVKEIGEATMDRFINGLNPELACFAETMRFLDIDILIPLPAKHEKNIKQQRCSESSTNTKEIESLIVMDPTDELVPAKEEEELNDESLSNKCEKESILIPSTILVTGEYPLNQEKKSENMSESDFCESVLDEKAQFSREKNIKRLECCQHNGSLHVTEKDSERESSKEEIQKGHKSL